MCVVWLVFQIPLRDGSVELKLPLMKAEDCGDDEEDDKIVVDTSHEITYGDLGKHLSRDWDYNSDYWSGVRLMDVSSRARISAVNCPNAVVFVT